MSVNERKDKSGKIEEVDLGLGQSESEALATCRAAIADDPALDDLRDATLARYLRHNSWAVDPAIKQMREYLAWRKNNNIDKILDNPRFNNFALIRTIVPYAYHGHDKEGRPIYIERTGLIATAALADPKITPVEDFIHSHIYGVELLQKQMYEHSLKTGKRVNGICTILDMEGLGFHHRQCLTILKQCLDFDKKYYPEYLGRLYIINSPWVTPYIYQAVQVFLDEVTKSRIQMVAGDPAAFLTQFIDAEHLPKVYGGNCTGESCKQGGCGPHYPELNLKGCMDQLDQSQLQAAPVSGLETQEVYSDFEKEIVAESEGDQVTWYFEVDSKYELDFSVELLPVSGVRETDVNKRLLVQKVERLNFGKGAFKVPYPRAKLIFRWDNSFGMWGSKKLQYTVQIIPKDTDLKGLDTNAPATAPAGGAAAASSSK